MWSVKWYEDWYQDTEHFVFKDELQRCCWSTLSVCLSRHVSPQVGFFHVNLQDVFKWWFVQSILWLSSAPCSADTRHRFSASGVQWSTRVRADRTSPWHWFVLVLTNVSLFKLNIYAKFLHLIHDSGLGLAKWRCATWSLVDVDW